MSIVIKLGAVALGGALGAVTRLLVTEWVQAKLHTTFPYGTMVVNLIGAFIIGLLMMYFLGTTSTLPWLKFMVVTGFLGGLTTFSTFSYEWVSLMEGAQYMGALIYGGVQLILGMLFCFLGMALGRILY